jgi:hypothetical protein
VLQNPLRRLFRETASRVLPTMTEMTVMGLFLVVAGAALAQVSVRGMQGRILPAFDGEDGGWPSIR